MTVENAAYFVPKTENEISAGIDKFAEFREFNVLWSIAGGDPLRLDDAFELEYNTAHLSLARTAMEARFSRALHKQMTQQ